MAPAPLPSLKEDEILALLSDEDDDDLGLISASDDEGEDEEDKAPPDIVEVLIESGELVVRYSLMAAPCDIGDLEDGEQNLTTLAPLSPDGRGVSLTPPPPDVILNPLPPGDADHHAQIAGSQEGKIKFLKPFLTFFQIEIICLFQY